MKTSTQIFVTLLFFFLGLSSLAAKDLAYISGNIRDQKDQHLPFVNVAIVESEGGALLTGAVTDDKGNFRIESSRSGKVQLVVSSIGFETYRSEIFEIKPGISKEFGTIRTKKKWATWQKLP